jgi:ornithine carbamoyltransferase
MMDEFGTIEGRTVAYVGDFNNVARSLVEACVILGSHCRIGCPEGYSIEQSELDILRSLGTGHVDVFVDPNEAVDGAHAVHTDTWVSMGQESEKESRRQIFADYRVDENLMKRAADDVIFMHCLPAYRGYEVTAEVIDGPRSRVIPQGHNRLDSARGVLSYLLEAPRDGGGRS